MEESDSLKSLIACYGYFYDSVVRKIEIDFSGIEAVYSVFVTIDARNLLKCQRWELVTIHFKDVIEISFQEGKFYTNKVVTELNYYSFNNLIVFDFSSNQKFESVDKMKKYSNFYIIAQKLEYSSKVQHF